MQNLSPYELRVVGLVAEGYTNKEIAKKLYMAEESVKNHLKALFDKIGARNRTQLTTKLFRSGIIK
jgi:DNA-binding CsgD family transcriptional regulator